MDDLPLPPVHVPGPAWSVATAKESHPGLYHTDGQ
jgi:hypothetical protein